ncbi:MAG: hypothetical protein N5P05_001215 [Chroococcopsis gigantea SAG 12.99]|jgi:diguanylate cyclase (GGDEF)-like protein|nr:EAL domain-containing protein [Chlorogloea purpurea SAG 13.99]MDV2999609.1 hypothetical protein [Chroococcopsis gigantea SAG 12.99]
MTNSLQKARHILVIEDERGRRTLSLEELKYAIGRKSDSGIVIYSKQASRHHATLVRKTNNQTSSYSYWILDGDLEGNKSHNGIYVNGTKCLVHELKNGDLINFGCEVNASYHMITTSGDTFISNEDQPLRTLGTEKETSSNSVAVATKNANQKSTLILQDSNTIHFADTIQEQTYLDLVTELPNKLLFSEYLSLAINNAIRNNRLIGLLLFDVEQLKNINNQYGYETGDRVLQGISKRLKDSVRGGDILARWSGDDFIVMLPQINSIEDVEKIKLRISKVFDSIFDVDGHKIMVNVSVGSAVYPHQGLEINLLIQNLEANLLISKRINQKAKQNTSVGRVNEESRLAQAEKMLQQALDKQEFQLYYQPQINSQTGQIEGLEALVRWKHPQVGLVPPNKFLPLAEKTNLIFPINRWIIQTASQQNKSWQKEGLFSIPITINISPQQFHDPYFGQLIKQVLEETGLEPHFLELEVTESNLLENLSTARQAILELQEIGISLSLDDFGLGYSSISYLNQLPIKKIKIAQSLVKELVSAEANTALIAAIIGLGKSFHVQVVAEGVENQQQLLTLQELGCVSMQGNRFSYPLPLQETTRFLRLHHTLAGQ